VKKRVSTSRHKRARRHPRVLRIAAIAVPAVILATAPAAVALWPEPSEEPQQVTMSTQLAASMRVDESLRKARVSRDIGQRSPLPTQAPTPAAPAPTPETAPEPAPTPTVVGTMYATAALKVRGGPSSDAAELTVVPKGTELGVTGTKDGAWVQVIHDETVAWVNGDYLAAEKPAAEVAEPAGGISYAPCPSGSDVEDGLTPDAIRVHRAVCAQFPSITNYGGLRGGGGEHAVGRALDIMVSGSLGDAVADWVRANHQVLGVSEVLWSQQIWTVQRSSEGWRPLEDRGSVTANHYDHVHVTVYGSSGG